MTDSRRHSRLRSIVNSSLNTSQIPYVPSIPDFPIINFDDFSPVSTEKMARYVSITKKTYCLNDAIDMRILDFDVVGGQLCEILCEIVNASFKTGVFPKSEKYSYVRPLIKANKDPSQLASYRPLFNTSFLAKLLENAALDQLKTHLGNFEYFSKFQSAYRKHHSVETALCKIYNDLVLRKASGGCAMLILIDQSAAFDTVDHSTLLQDLHDAGVGGHALNWFKTYLENRPFKVAIDGVCSD